MKDSSNGCKLYNVTLAAGSTVSGVTTRSAAEALHYESICGWLNTAYAECVRRRFYGFGIFTLELTQAQMKELLRDNRILEVQEVTVFERTGYQETADWGLEVACGNSVGAGFNYRHTGEGIKIYIVDSGIELTHQEFGGRAVHGYDATVESPLDPTDEADRSELVSAHGTIVASAAAGFNTGVAKKATLIDCKAGDADPMATPPSSFTSANIVECLEWIYNSRLAANDLSTGIVNCSWGSTTSDSAVNTALDTLISSGCIVIASAGNNGNNVAFYPAANANVIAVGAIQEDLDIAPFSNYGSYVDIFAPGRFLQLASLGGSIAEASGTSIAAPIVSGAAACSVEGMTGIDQTMFRKIMIKYRQKNKSIHVKASTTKDVINTNMIKTWYGETGSVGGLLATKRYIIKPFRQVVASPDTITYLTSENKIVDIKKQAPVLVKHGLSVVQNFAVEIRAIKSGLITDITAE